MRKSIFEALSPQCPRCLHADRRASPLSIAHVSETRADHIWRGILHCSDQSCWMEFPIIDGIPIVVPDPRTFLVNTQAQILRRPAFELNMTSLIGDALGAGSEFDTTRQHLSLYAGAQFTDWAGLDFATGFVPTFQSGAALMGGVRSGPAIDIGGSVGRAGWELANGGADPVIVADLNFSMLQLGQVLALEGAATFDLRDVGLVYERHTIEVPDGFANAAPDFWAVDATTLPFQAETFQTACALNIVDCIASPTAAIVEMARVLAPNGHSMVCTPYDWSNAATEIDQWLGGHSQRAFHKGRSEDVLRQTLAQAGVPVIAESNDQVWRLRTHARATMEYQLHLLGCQRTQT